MVVLQSRADLLRNFSRGHRPREEWALGLEYEQFVTRPDGTPVPYSGPQGVEVMLTRLWERTGWTPVQEQGRILALRADDGRSITLEPGAQIEFGSRAVSTMEEMEHEVAEYFALLKELREEFGVRFVALGAQPTSRPDQIERIPKARYDILEPYLQGAGDLGVWMMKATAGIQMNFDHADADDAALKLRTAFAVSPILTALAANSSVRAGEVSGYATWRGHVWSRTDPFRCGIIDACTGPDSSLEDLAEWALRAPMLFVEREGRLVDMRAWTFEEYFRHGADGMQATEEDWDLHLSTLFPEVRLRPQLELRCLDTQCPDGALAMCALVKGLFYDEFALQQSWELTAEWTAEQRLRSWHDAHRFGMQAQGPDGRSLGELAGELLSFARLPEEESSYLAPLHSWVQRGTSPGECTAQLFQEKWRGDMKQLVAASACLGEQPV